MRKSLLHIRISIEERHVQNSLEGSCLCQALVPFGKLGSGPPRFLYFSHEAQTHDNE